RTDPAHHARELLARQAVRGHHGELADRQLAHVGLREREVDARLSRVHEDYRGETAGRAGRQLREVARALARADVHLRDYAGERGDGPGARQGGPRRGELGAGALQCLLEVDQLGRRAPAAQQRELTLGLLHLLALSLDSAPTIGFELLAQLRLG